MILASWGPHGKGLGALLGRLGGLLGRLEAVLGVLGRSFGDSRLSMTVLGASWGPLGLCWGRLGLAKVTREAATKPRGHAGSPGRLVNLGSGPLKDSSGVRTEA